MTENENQKLQDYAKKLGDAAWNTAKKKKLTSKFRKKTSYSQKD